MDEDLEVASPRGPEAGADDRQVGESLPGLGIVAAVLGVVITMGAIDGPPSEIGHKVGAALVGTFLGILAVLRLRRADGRRRSSTRSTSRASTLSTIKAGVLALSKGLAPAIAVEFARRSIPAELRPNFYETEQYCRAPQAGRTAEAA